jgi:chondroitin AC lyase
MRTALVLVVLLTAPAVRGADDLETVRQRLTAEWSAPGTAEMRRLLDTQGKDGSWPDIDYNDPATTTWPSLQHMDRARDLALMWADPHSELHREPRVREAVGRAWEFWFRRDPVNENWWHNEIGVPRALAPALLMLKEKLTPREKEQGLRILRRSEIKGESQNLVWLAEINALRGLIADDSDLVQRAYGRIAQEIRTVPSEGLQADMSLLQHRGCLYNHGYGASFAVDGTRLARLLEGTKFALSKEKTDLLAAYLLDGSQWMALGRAADFAARGREIARPGSGPGWKSYLQAAAENLLALKTPPRTEELHALVSRLSAEPGAPPLQGAKHFWRSDFSVAQGPGFYASVRMYSDRIANTDFNGPENLLGHHLADGVTTLMTHGREYAAIFPLWDWQKLPGVTARQSPPLQPGAPRRDKGSRRFVGGVSDGQAAFSAFDFERDGLTAKKAWLLTPAGMLGLGAGINDESGSDVVTTVNQCLQSGAIVTDGDRVSQDGLVYVALQNTAFRQSGEKRDGRWQRIHQQESDEEVTGDVFTLWIDHGHNPRNATYAYAVAPEGSAMPRTKVPANTSDLQVAEMNGWMGMAFYQPGRLPTAGFGIVSAEQPCLLLLRRGTGGALELSVSDPTTKLAEVKVSVGSQHLTVVLPQGESAGATVTRTIKP